MNTGPSRQYNSNYPAASPPDDSIMSRVIKPNIMVYGIIAVCALVFIWEYIDLQATALLWMWPTYPMPWMFVTSIFLHGGFEHIFFNMLMLFMFGVTLERMLGNWRFLGLFLGAGIAGNIGYVIFCMATGSDVPAIGASGAIYGVFACLAILAPHIRVYLFMIVPLKIFYAFLLYAAIDIVFLNSDDSVAHAAHIAGALVGVAYAMHIKRQIKRQQTYSVSYDFKAEM
jgi:hypothetical protein